MNINERNTIKYSIKIGIYISYYITPLTLMHEYCCRSASIFDTSNNFKRDSMFS